MTKKTIIEFPCHFPIKIIGTNSDEFHQQMKQIVLSHFPEFTDEKISHTVSKQSNYLARTVTVFAENQEMLDAFYREISSHPEVKMVL